MAMRMMRCLLAGIASMLLCGCTQADQSGTMKVKEIDELIRKEVPIGSSTSQVLAFLDAQKIEHSQQYFDRDRIIYASIRNTSGNWLVKNSVYIQFHFDEKATLKDYSVREVSTGP